MAQIEFTVVNQIKEAFHLTEDESEAALLLLKNYAHRQGMTLAGYMETHHPRGLVQKDEHLSEHYKGYVQFLGEDAKSIIFAGKNADYSTFIHECAHVFRRQLTGKLRDHAEKLFGVKDGVWTVEQDEQFAGQLEHFIKTRQAEESKRKLMRSGAAFVRDTYNGLSHIIDLKPEIREVFEDMFQNADTDYVFKQKEYEDALHQIAIGEQPDRKHIFLGMTPPLYGELGLESRPLMIQTWKLHTAMNEPGSYHGANFHGLGEELLRQIPESLKHPLCVIQSATIPEDIISVVELRDKNNQPVIVPVAQNEKGYLNDVEIDTSLVRSIYGRERFDLFLRDAINDNRLLYVDKKRSRTLLQSHSGIETRSGVQELTSRSRFNITHDISGFYLENIARYQAKVKEKKERDKKDGFTRLSGAMVLFQTNAAQMEFDFGDTPKPIPAPARVLASPDSGTVRDYTGFPANTVLLANEKSVLTDARPPYVPEIDLRYMRHHCFLPPFCRDGENFILHGDKNITYRMTQEVLAATVDYYAKVQKAANREKAQEHNKKPGVRTIQPERVAFLPRDKMTTAQQKLFEDTGISGKAAWAEYFTLRDAMRQKLSDMSLQKEDWENAFIKGRETAYGDGNTSDTLYKDYGVLVKRQNGDAIRPDEVHDVEKALNGAASVFGDLRAISGQYGLKISHSGERNMHARQAAGIFHSRYRAVGVSFADREAAPFILAHETAHFLDCAAGKKDNHFFASDKSGTPENIAALKFREHMNKTQERTAQSPYLNRTCECFARAMEQYAAYKLSNEQYALFCAQEGYVNHERFTAVIVPAIETVTRERETFWHPEKNRSREAAAEIPAEVPQTEEKPKDGFRPYGAWTDYGRRLSVRERELVNAAALEAIHKPIQDFTEHDRNIVRRYSGFGGISVDDERGVLYDYYTSPPVAKMTWDLLWKITPVEPGESVLEPSCGTGVFFETAPQGLRLNGVELDERTASIASRLHPEADVENASFERFNLTSDTQFDHVIGNVPFGERSVETAFLDMPEEKSLDKYFIARSIDRLKPGGTMALIVHPGVLSNKTNEDWRLVINRNAQFLGAVKLNDSSFTHTHTSVQPDILFFQKYPEDIRKRLKTVTDTEFKRSPLYADDWVKGSYFETRASHIMGEIESGAGQWGNDVVRGEVTPESVQSLTEAFTPERRLRAEVFQGIRETYELQKVETEAQTHVPLSAAEGVLAQQKILRQGSVKVSDGSIYILNNTFSWEFAQNEPALAGKVERVGEIAANVGAIRRLMREEQSAADIQKETREKLTEYRKQYGAYPAEDTDVNRFLRQHPSVSGVYESFIKPEADLLTQANLYDTSGELVNGHNQAIETLLLLREQMRDGTEENIEKYFPETKETLFHEFQRNPDIFLTPDNTWQLREDFISGNAWEKIDALNSATEKETDEAKRQKLEYGAAQLREAAGWMSIEDADFTPHSSWIPERIINSWITDKDGLDYSVIRHQGKLSRNDEGKWGLLNKSTKRWEEYANEIVYYLNMQKQRSKYYDTETYNREHNDSFKNYIANHPAYRDELEKTYNRIFNTEIGGPVKTYPVYLDGWETGTKTLRGHQWQSVHHLYREGKGISALGTGFGKTLAATGLQALLQQEQKINRAWFQVPNNKVKDWVAEIQGVMPGRKIGYVDPETPGYTNREKRFALYQNLANSNYDVLIMPESAASEIQLRPENDTRIREEIIAAQVTDKAPGASSRKVQQVRDNAARNLENGKTNKTITFEDFGCDAVFVDEAHRYKNLFSSSLSRETGLNDGRQSAKAMALFKKTEYIRSNHDGKNVFLLTATPLTNSPLEYYNMLMYVAPEELKKFGINTIDGFIKNFADIEEKQTYDWKSGQIAKGRVLTGFKNIQTLQDVFFKYTDYQNDPAKINLQKPDANNRPNVIPRDTKQTAVLKDLSEQLAAYQALDKEERESEYPGQNFLTFYSKMRTASLDLELYDPKTYKAWDNPKLNRLAQNAYENYKTAHGGQVAFCDRVFSSDYSFNIHQKMKAALVKAGFKDNEIIIVNGFTKSGGLKNDSAVEKEVSEAVEAYNSGKYKVIIGSTACIGEGLNLQANSSALHHFDIPFRPSDFIQRNGRIDRQGNAQKNVELHTYMSAGTIDNYSVSLVEKKAGWIDKLLKTKSNVFINKEDESYVDADELLLALTESWGDKEKAAERRQEMERIRGEKLLEARDKERRDTTASLVLMRNAVLTFNGDKGTAAFQTRLRKIEIMEKALINNPTFKDREIIGSGKPFLYSKAGDYIIRKGDVILDNGNVNTVTALNLKRQEFTIESERKTPSYRRRDFPADTYKQITSYSIYSYKLDEDMTLLHDPREELRNQLKNLHTKDFYRQPDEFKEKYYQQHLMAVENNGNFTAVYLAADNENKKLKIDEFRDSSPKECLNPFSEQGRRAINEAAKHGVVISGPDQMTALKECLPNLHRFVSTKLAAQEKTREPVPQKKRTEARDIER
jgi:hypothetical protein